MSEEFIQHNDRLKGPDLDVFEVGPGGEKRPLPSREEEEARFKAEIEGDRARRDAIIDEFMADAPSNTNQSSGTTEPSSEDLERMSRAAYQLMNEFPKALVQRLAPHGLTVRGMLPDGHGNGYVIYVVDNERREFPVQMGHEDTNRAFAELGSAMGVALVDLVERRVLAERKRYFERMGGQSSGLIIL
jgi:hypothetical protein